MNIQRIEKLEQYESNPVGSLDVQEIFTTIQGEGPRAGQSAVFVRLAGCNLQCPLCDTDYTSQRRRMTVEEMTLAVYQKKRSGLVVITGGEPFRQKMDDFIKSLYSTGDYIVQIETNGTIYDNGVSSFVEVVCSPKTGKIAKDLSPHAYKYVLCADEVVETDGLPLRALHHPASPMLARPPIGFEPSKIYLQPADEGNPEKNKRNLDACIDSVHRFGYTLSIQQHKIIDLP